MPYAQTKFELIDRSFIPELPSQANSAESLFLCASSTDKGDEKMMVFDNAVTFAKAVGEISFSRHGQALLQADRILQYGGRILFKRIVAEDSTLANAIIVAKCKTARVQKTDSEGRKIYTDNKTHLETTDENDEDQSPNQPVMIDEATISYSVEHIDNAKTIADVINKANDYLKTDTQSDGYKHYPIIILTDRGRGVSNKRFRISPDYNSSAGMDFTRYVLNIIEGDKNIANASFGANPDATYYNEAYSIEATVNNDVTGLMAKVLDSNMYAYEEELRKCLKNDAIGSLFTQDIFFGKTKDNKEIPGMKLDITGANLTSVYGIQLEGGSNGSFGEQPMNNDTTKKKVYDETKKFFDGEIDDEIFDIMKHQITACIDACYPEEVKRSIEGLVKFRQDFFFFRDMEFTDNFEIIKKKMNVGAKSNMVAAYFQSFIVTDPYTQKKIPVTISYGLARILPRHFRLNPGNPMNGIRYDFILDEAHPNTINLVPKVTPKMDQKQFLDDLRVNYASYIKDDLVIESQYTTQDVHTQLSYASNMIQLQRLIRDIRVRCPIIRYAYIEGDDLEEYQNEVKDIIEKHKITFAQIDFKYLEDPVMKLNKIFYAAIVLRHLDYAQSEWFKIYDIVK